MLAALVVAVPWSGRERSRRDLWERFGPYKGPVGLLRSALSAYYGDTEGRFPATLDVLRAERFLPAIPEATTEGRHPDSADVFYGTEPDDAGGWLYNNRVGDPGYGTVWINCTHTDGRGKAWTAY